MWLVHWNGAEVPTELAALPPGRYVMEPVDAVAPLSETEEQSLIKGLASLDRGEGLSEEEMDARVAELLRR